MLLGALPKTFQDGATKLLHNHLKNSSHTSAVSAWAAVGGLHLPVPVQGSLWWAGQPSCALSVGWGQAEGGAMSGPVHSQGMNPLFKWPFP